MEAFLPLNDGVVPNDCQGPEWIYRYFGECIVSTHQMIAFYIGLMSIVCWLFAQTPQLITNYKNGNADSLSALFLFQWLAGDSLNLIGSVLSNQQVYCVGVSVHARTHVHAQTHTRGGSRRMLIECPTLLPLTHRRRKSSRPTTLWAWIW